MDKETNKNNQVIPNRSDLFSKQIKAGKRVYYFDVKSTIGADYYLTISETKRTQSDGGLENIERHKIFLYKEDFEKFTSALEEAVSYIKELQQKTN